MDPVGASALSLASLYALYGQAMPTGAAAPAGEAATLPALAMQAAAMATSEALVATLLGAAQAGGGGAALAQALASLSHFDPSAELARLGG